MRDFLEWAFLWVVTAVVLLGLTYLFELMLDGMGS